jgi:hypothetical protein
MTVITVQNKEVWDRFVDQSPHGLIFHKWEFLKIVEKYSGYTFLPYGIVRGETLIGLFPLFHTRIGFFSRVFSPPPISGLPYLGFLMGSEYENAKQDRKETYLSQVIDQINDEINLLSPNYISIYSTPGFLDIRPFIWNNYTTDPKFNYVINLNPDLNSIRSGFKLNLRKQLSLSEKQNLRLVPDTNLSSFCDLMIPRYKEQGLNFSFYNSDYLSDLFKMYPEQLKLYSLYQNNDLIGGILTQEYKKFLTWHGNAKIIDGVYGNEFIIWQLIQKAKGEGYSKLELTGANLRSLSQFKSKFNPSLEICYNAVRKDSLGKIAEWTYINFVRKRH